MSPVAVTLVAKPGCHLCDAARDVVRDVVRGLPAPASVTVDELSILDDPTLFDRYAEEIPVVLIDGRVHAIWRVDRTRLENALREPNA